jgi:hypothetical protein
MSDLWNAFGDDSDVEEENDCTNNMSQILLAGVSYLTQHFMKHNPQIKLNQRILATTENSEWILTLNQRGFQIVHDSTSLCDAVIISNNDFSQLKCLVPGGCVLILRGETTDSHLSRLHPQISNSSLVVAKQNDRILEAFTRWNCPSNTLSCCWKPNIHKFQELNLIQKATIVRSAHEIIHHQPLSSFSTNQAVYALQTYGYCIIRQLLDPSKCVEWGHAALQDFKQGSQILKDRDDIDLYNPHESRKDPHNFRELSMREDLRLDLRDGPQIRRMRIHEEVSASGSPTIHIFKSSNDMLSEEISYQSCLRFHPDVLRIVQKTMNPSDPKLSPGNFGRYNFDGSGPDGSPQPMRIGPMGSIISLPGSADQAIHADTPHLWETHDCLPAHYINAFTLGIDPNCERDELSQISTGATHVGGTAFIQASHKLSFTASLSPDWSVTQEPQVLQNLVRPSLELGDILLFDCRILHFGLANTSKNTERPILYTNMTQAWFHDPKNWDDRATIFDIP